MNIIIRADGGENIGIGHIMRCLAIAFEFKKRGCRVLFAVNNSESAVLKIKRMGFETIIFPETLNLNEVSEFQSIVNKIRADVLIVDSYNVTPEYFSRIKQIAGKIVYIDDLNMFNYDADMVINGNVYAESLAYAQENSSTRFILGSKYTIIRDEFTEISPKQIKQKVQNAFITAGGSDSWGLVPSIIRCFEKAGLIENINLDVVIGPAFKNIEQITDKYRRLKNVRLHINVESMSEIMSQSDIAITAGGSTVYELALLGIPSIIIATADNQLMLVDKMMRMAAAHFIGYVADLTDEQIINALDRTINDYEYRCLLSKNSRRIIDGKGAQRCVDEIINIVAK